MLAHPTTVNPEHVRIQIHTAHNAHLVHGKGLDTHHTPHGWTTRYISLTEIFTNTSIIRLFIGGRARIDQYVDATLFQDGFAKATPPFTTFAA